MMSIKIKNKLSEIDDIVKHRFHNQTCYFRGEPEFYKTISASLYRDRKVILPMYEDTTIKPRTDGGSLEFEEATQITVSIHPNSLVHGLKNLEFEVSIRSPENLYELTKSACSFITEQTQNSTDTEVDLGILQHLGYPTPYLDLTKELLVALFFACQDSPNKDGRIIILGDNGNYKIIDMTLADFSIAKERAIAQNSVMLQKLDLKHEDNYEECCIPLDLKKEMLIYLEEHNINKSSLFPDDYDYAKEYEPYRKFYEGVQAEVKGNALDAINQYTAAIDLNPNFAWAYKRRGRILYHRYSFQNAQFDLEKACKLDEDDEIIGLHPFFDEHNAGCMHRRLGEIYKINGNIRKSQTYMRRAEYLQHRYNRREENKNSSPHKKQKNKSTT